LNRNVSRNGALNLVELVGTLLDHDALALCNVLEASACLAFRITLKASMSCLVMGVLRGYLCISLRPHAGSGYGGVPQETPVGLKADFA
jgi:hypothetical protein